MFKYIWIIMVGFVVAAFVAYTVYCCNQAAKDAESILDWYDNMGMDHEGILIGWSIIIIFGMIILFIASFVAFASSFG